MALYAVLVVGKLHLLKRNLGKLEVRTGLISGDLNNEKSNPRQRCNVTLNMRNFPQKSQTLNMTLISFCRLFNT